MAPPFPIPNREVKHISANNTRFARNLEDRSRPGDSKIKRKVFVKSFESYVIAIIPHICGIFDGVRANERGGTYGCITRLTFKNGISDRRVAIM